MSHSKNARWLAVKALHNVIEGRGSLDSNLDSLDKDLGPGEKSLARMIASVSARHWFQLSAVLDELMPKPLRAKDAIIKTLLITGLAQLAHSRQADYAVVKESVALVQRLKKPWARGLVNAVLRAYQREPARWMMHRPDDMAKHNHPKWLIDELRRAWPQHWEQILSANNARPVMALRVNQRKTNQSDYIKLLASHEIEANPGLGVHTVLLKQPVNVQQLPGFLDGLCSVQDTSAQWAADLLALSDGHTVLDACAAPGGKTGHILETAAVSVLALDLVQKRLARVTENLDRLGLSAEIQCADATQPLNQQFDRILLDAPCSGTGVIRRHPDIRLARDPEQILENVTLSQRILENLWQHLKPGGRMVYATCSTLPSENEDLITDFINQTSDARSVKITLDGINGLPGGLIQTHGTQILPSELDVDGFYYCVLIKSPEISESAP